VINPFLPVPDRAPIEDDDTDRFDEVFGAHLRLVGPPVPIEVPAPDLPDSLVLPCEPVGEAAHASLLWVMSLHGGSGASTLTGILGTLAASMPFRESLTSRRVTESPRSWPCGPGPALASTVLLVARTHAAGLVAADAAAHHWATGQLIGIRLLGLVLVDDAPHLTGSQHAFMLQVASTVPNCWHLPWQEEWREIRTPSFNDASRRVRRIGTNIINCAREIRVTPER